MPSSDFRTPARNCIETLLIAAAGGMLFGLPGVPGGYLSGSLVAVAIAGIAGRPTFVPLWFTRIVLFSLGVVLGSIVTPDTLKGVATWPISILMLALTLAGIFAATSSYLRFFHGWDTLSALFASSPGALSQVVALAIGTNVNVPAIVIVQTMRVVFLAVGTPLVLAAFGFAPSSSAFFNAANAGGHSLPGLAVLIAVCVMVTIVFQKLRIPGGMIFGAMVGSSVLHGSGLITARLPNALTLAAMIGVGAMTGSRFNGTTVWMLLRHIKAAVGAFAVALTVATGFSLMLVAFFPFRLSDVVLAFSPGAQDAMMILVLSLSGDPVYVGAHHVARFIMVSTAMPIMVRVFGGAKVRPNPPRTDALPDD